ncbi:MAG TPA: XRE family transcriptional regulator, partial [Pasteurellaceae bacterium]|nr:XRE family transcriptional regulator [Pasteurellaceae bacterium]
MKRNFQQRNTQQRRHAIMQLLQERGEVNVDQLVQLFETSEVTIRKDLTALEANGFLLRRYGGAIMMPKELIEEPQEDSLSQRKLAIAKAAAERIRDHNRIIVDSGSTTAALIKQLNRKQGLIVMTNSLSVATELRSLENEPTLLMTGGTWDIRSESWGGGGGGLFLFF